MPTPIITLTTDFGLTDHFIGTMKGVILSICRDACIVDISHGVRAFAIAEGAFTIDQSWRYFPLKTVHVVVVDPGVGTARRPILVEAAGHYFVGPDNGVLSMVYSRERSKVREISNNRLFLQPTSNTFHGRDVFAPVAARLAAGISPALLGDVITDYASPKFLAAPSILKIDHFGNVITNLTERPGAVEINGIRIAAHAQTYEDAPPGEPFLILGSSGYYEISMRRASAAARLQCESGAPLNLDSACP